MGNIASTTEKEEKPMLVQLVSQKARVTIKHEEENILLIVLTENPRKNARK